MFANSSIRFAALAVLPLAVSLAADAPRPAPRMVFPTPDGRSVDTYQHLGKIVALEFILTTCPHCQDTSRALQRLQDEFGAKGFQALAVATNPMSHMLIPDFLKNFGVRFPVGYTQSEKAYEYLQFPSTQIMYYPQMVFIDRKGTIVRHAPGGDELFRGSQEKNIREQVDKMFSGAPAPAVKKPAAPAPARKAG